MADLTFKDFFPTRSITTIKSGSELYLAYALDKYCVSMLGCRFSIEGLNIDKHVLRSDYTAFLIHNAFKISVTLPFTKEEREAWLNKANWTPFFTGSVDNVKPASYDANSITYTFVEDVVENRVMNSSATSTAYVALLAHTLVTNYKNKTNRVLIIDNTRRQPRVGEYNDLSILRDFGNKLIDSTICDFAYAESDERQPDYEAYVAYNQQRGYMSRVYTANEKFRVCGKSFKVGDPVLVYKKRDLNKRSLFKPLNSCNVAIVRGIDKNGVTIEELPYAETRLTQLRETEEKIARNPTIYTENDKYTFTTSVHSYPWTDIGIGVCTYDEPVFITEVFADDFSNQWLATPEGDEKHLQLGTRDAVYAVLVDRDIKFNRVEYATKYFTSKGFIPVFEEYLPSDRVPLDALKK